jgi:hypothetical protein
MVPALPFYDEIGRSYAATRRADPRIAQQIHATLGPGDSQLNGGAGTGSYEPISTPAGGIASKVTCAR